MHAGDVHVDFVAMNRRIRELAQQQSDDIGARLLREGITVLPGSGRFASVQPGRTHRIEVLDADGRGARRGRGRRRAARDRRHAAGAAERPCPTASGSCPGAMSTTLTEAPEHLVVVGSGVTGAEFASGYSELGVPVTLVSSRDRVLPGEDADAAAVIEEVFTLRGGTLVKQARAAAVRRDGDGVVVELVDGRTVAGSHALICVGSLPNTAGLGPGRASGSTSTRPATSPSTGSRAPTCPTIYAAGDCTGVLALASVAAMQGRIAMWHALGEAVAPLRLKTVSANVFTNPEIATRRHRPRTLIASGEVPARTVKLPLATNARAKMQGQVHGFIKLTAGPPPAWSSAAWSSPRRRRS